MKQQDTHLPRPVLEQVYLVERDTGLLVRILGLYASRGIDVRRADYAYAAPDVMTLKVTAGIEDANTAETLRVLVGKAATLVGVIVAAEQPPAVAAYAHAPLRTRSASQKCSRDDLSSDRFGHRCELARSRGGRALFLQPSRDPNQSWLGGGASSACSGLREAEAGSGRQAIVNEDGSQARPSQEAETKAACVNAIHAKQANTNETASTTSAGRAPCDCGFDHLSHLAERYDVLFGEMERLVGSLGTKHPSTSSKEH